MRLWLLVRRPVGDEDGELNPTLIARAARITREVLERELGVEVVIDANLPEKC